MKNYKMYSATARLSKKETMGSDWSYSRVTSSFFVWNAFMRIMVVVEQLRDNFDQTKLIQNVDYVTSNYFQQFQQKCITVPQSALTYSVIFCERPEKVQLRSKKNFFFWEIKTSSIFVVRLMMIDCLTCFFRHRLIPIRSPKLLNILPS